MERERVYGPGHFASSQMSLMGRDEVQPSTTITSKTVTTVDGKMASTQAQHSDMTGKVDYSMALPRLPYDRALSP